LPLKKGESGVLLQGRELAMDKRRKGDSTAECRRAIIIQAMEGKNKR